MPSKYGFGNTRKVSPHKKSSGFKMKGSPYRVEEKKGLQLPKPKDIVHAISPTTGILSSKNIISTAKNLWKKHGPVINPSTKNPKGVGK
jgi:hypothetical protein